MLKPKLLPSPHFLARDDGKSAALVSRSSGSVFTYGVA